MVDNIVDCNIQFSDGSLLPSFSEFVGNTMMTQSRVSNINNPNPTQPCLHVSVGDVTKRIVQSRGRAWSENWQAQYYACNGGHVVETRKTNAKDVKPRQQQQPLSSFEQSLAIHIEVLSAKISLLESRVNLQEMETNGRTQTTQETKERNSFTNTTTTCKAF